MSEPFRDTGPITHAEAREIAALLAAHKERN